MSKYSQLHGCIPLCPSRLWFMERLLGAAKPFSLTSLPCCCTSSLSTFRSPSSPPHAIHPCAACQASVVRHMSFGMAICKMQIHWGKMLEFRLKFEWSEYLVTDQLRTTIGWTLLQQIAKVLQQASWTVHNWFYHIWIWLSFSPQHALPRPRLSVPFLLVQTVNQLWSSTVQLACCKTFAICSTKQDST